MPSFSVSATIKAPQSSVWATLADIGTMDGLFPLPVP